MDKQDCKAASIFLRRQAVAAPHFYWHRTGQTALLQLGLMHTGCYPRCLCTHKLFWVFLARLFSGWKPPPPCRNSGFEEEFFSRSNGEKLGCGGGEHVMINTTRSCVYRFCAMTPQYGSFFFIQPLCQHVIDFDRLAVHGCTKHLSFVPWAHKIHPPQGPMMPNILSRLIWLTF